MIPALLIWAAAATNPPPIDGALLYVGDACYTIPASQDGGKSVGNILRRVERRDDKRLMITVVSRFNGGPLLTSRMEVSFPSLRPIRTTEETDGKTSLTVSYGDTDAQGTVTGGDGLPQTSTTPLPGPVWDDETTEFVLTTLPLADGAHFEVPVFHFGRGVSTTTVDVRRSIRAGGFGRGPIAAWEIDVSTRTDMTINFLVAKADRRLLAIEVGGVRSILGGDCSELIK
jgi:hypothetical protein